MSLNKKAMPKRYGRRLLIFTVCFGIILSLYPNMAGKAFALGEGTSASSGGEAAWYNESGELTYGSFTQAIANVSTGGTVILRSDIELTAGITVSKPMYITSWDENAPCTIKNKAADSDSKSETGRIFTVNGGELRLQHIILDGGKEEGAFAYHPLICISGGGVLRTLEGTVLQNAENKSESMCGGGVNIRYGAFYMYDGSLITGCKSRHGGGIDVNSKNKTPGGAMFGMAGGCIENCTADCGGGVYVNIGQFQMAGGKITGNEAAGNVYKYGGGGIYVAGERYTAAVRITGGEISGNTAVSTGGGVLVNGGYTLLQIEGGSFENNRANTGGGVSMLTGTLRLYGGTVTNNTAELYGGGVLGSPDSVILLQGAPKVYGNTAKDKEDIFDNLYLDGADDDGYPTSPIGLAGPLTEGVELGMSRWVCPDEEAHPFRQMIVPYNGYTITQADLDRLCSDRSAENKELYADNPEKYAFIPYNNEIVMVMAVDVRLDRENLSFIKTTDTPVTLNATVTPGNAPEKGVTWKSSDENVARVDENGRVTPAGKGKAIITATTKSPYHASASCTVTVGYKLTAKAEHGTNTFTPDDSDGYFLGGERITLNVAADEEYRFYSLKAYRTDDKSAEVVINDDNTLIMPNHNVTVEAVFEPIPYPIGYNLEGGALEEGKTNPDFYTIESGEITLNAPIRDGYTFVGWTGTGLTEPSLVVKIPSGSTGEREYTAVWEEKTAESTDASSESSAPTDSGSETSGGDALNTGDDSAPASSESAPAHNEDIPPEDGSLLGNDGEPPRGDSPSDNDDESPLGESPLTGNENGTEPLGNRQGDEGNPTTGGAVSLIPLIAVIFTSFITAAAKRKEKNL